MLGFLLLVIGAALLVYGALGASKSIDLSQSDGTDAGFAFLAGVIAPLLGGALLVVIALMELDLF